MDLNLTKTHPDAKLPQRGSKEDAGLDFFLPEDVTLHPGEVMRIGHGWKLAIPKNHVGILTSSSSIEKW